ncbi:MAG: type II toxin-antitoxin system death-on-curing family toxin [Methylocystis sp.]|nr:type II toxin-antitoxin system death-on-curing family toxin [Methylocystis sp.]
MSWQWLDPRVVIAIHAEQTAEHGGSAGVRDDALLSSALARARNRAAHSDASVFDLAAAYAFGIIKNHPFVDGNKRAGFLAAYVFLDLHGWELAAAEADAAQAALALAAGDIGELEFAEWLKSNSVRSTT